MTTSPEDKFDDEEAEQVEEAGEADSCDEDSISHSLVSDAAASDSEKEAGTKNEEEQYGQDELDYDEEYNEETKESKGDNKAGMEKGREKEGENIEHLKVKTDGQDHEVLEAREKQPGKKEKKDREEGEASDDDAASDDCEEGEIKGDDSGKESPTPAKMTSGATKSGESRQMCRFYLRGICSWGPNCRFLHPGINDTMPMHKLMAIERVDRRFEVRMKTDEALLPAPPPREAPTETAWERGLRQAKEMMRKANQRKETEADFEKKKMNLSLNDETKESAEKDHEADPYYDNVLDNDDNYGSPPQWEGNYENFEIRGSYRARGQRSVEERPSARGFRLSSSSDRGGRRSRGRGDEWTDPWMRSKSPKKNRSRSRSHVRTRNDSFSSESSRSSSASSNSSRSSSFSSRSSSDSGSSSYSYRKLPYSRPVSRQNPILPFAPVDEKKLSIQKSPMKLPHTVEKWKPPKTLLKTPPIPKLTMPVNAPIVKEDDEAKRTSASRGISFSTKNTVNQRRQLKESPLVLAAKIEPESDEERPKEKLARIAEGKLSRNVQEKGKIPERPVLNEKNGKQEAPEKGSLGVKILGPAVASFASKPISDKSRLRQGRGRPEAKNGGRNTSRSSSRSWSFSSSSSSSSRSGSISSVSSVSSVESHPRKPSPPLKRRRISPKRPPVEPPSKPKELPEKRRVDDGVKKRDEVLERRKDDKGGRKYVRPKENRTVGKVPKESPPPKTIKLSLLNKGRSPDADGRSRTLKMPDKSRPSLRPGREHFDQLPKPSPSKKPSAAISGKAKKSNVSRREELLKQLKAVEEAIARKRQKES